VIARAGAMSIAELTFLGIDTLLIPLPDSAGNHQVKNALSLKDYNNFTVCLQEKMSSEVLINFLQHSCHNSSISAEYFVHPQREIINQCLNL
jgi:UDP-N-acetylglucosamine--N-acetylmuramyl-(pentapeptide) pyrophosphoryl-undecaprenol N-acetylglucosamine transferase